MDAPKPLTIVLANSGRRWIGEIAHMAMLYEQLEALGHRPWIVCRRGYALEAHARDRGWRMLPLTFQHGFSLKDDLSDIRRWRRLVREESVDIIHCHRGKDHWLGLVVARWMRRPLVRTRHVVMPVRRDLLNRWLYLSATDAVLSVSGAVEEGFGAWRKRLPRRQVILSAVDMERFNPRRRNGVWRVRHVSAPFDPAQGGQGEPLWFGLVGRMQAIKGHDVFLRAAARVADDCPAAHFMIAGHGRRNQRRRLEQRARELGLGDRVWVARHLDNLPKVLASIDVGVIASVGSEGSSRIALEMMASGLPLAATDVGGIAELTVKSGAVRLVPPDDAAALATAMLAWAHDPERGEAGRRARAHVESYHRPREWARKFVAVYIDVLKKPFDARK